MQDFESVWQRITALAGQEFRQETGRAFTYQVTPGAVVPSTTNRMLPRGQFKEAFQRMPVSGPGRFSALQGPSYLYAILSDPGSPDLGPREDVERCRIPFTSPPARAGPGRRSCQRPVRRAECRTGGDCAPIAGGDCRCHDHNTQHREHHRADPSDGPRPRGSARIAPAATEPDRG